MSERFRVPFDSARVAALRQPTGEPICSSRLRELRGENTDQDHAENEKAERDMHVHYGTILSATNRRVRQYCYSNFLVTRGIFNDCKTDLAIGVYRRHADLTRLKSDVARLSGERNVGSYNSNIDPAFTAPIGQTDHARA